MATPRKTGLGKGLDALFATGIQEDKEIPKKQDEKTEQNEEIKGKVLNLKINAYLEILSISVSTYIVSQKNNKKI